MSDERFSKTYRLCKSAQFDTVFQHRCSVADEHLVIYGDLNELPYSRIGLVVSRKVGNAVKRNRWKRILREAFRRQQTELPSGIDFVVIPRTPTKPNYHEITISIQRLAKRLEQKLKRSK